MPQDFNYKDVLFSLNNDKYELVITERENFFSVFVVLRKLLVDSNNQVQSEFIDVLIKLLEQNDLTQFVKSINGVEMWGGSGAVWEVYIVDKKKQAEFEAEILNLIYLMEKTEIIGKGIKPIKKLFENNIKEM